MAQILFVDDDPLTLQTLKKSVELFGHQAILANSGEEALALAIEHLPDLILTDRSLPDMDGLALIQRFQQEQILKDIPMIMLSASPELDASQLALAAGAREFLAKPVRLQTLEQVIQRYTGG
jgi:twitching motility two-component system response regulator PilH